MTAIKVPVLGARHLQVLLLFLTIVVNYGTKLHITVSLIAMTDAKTTNPNFKEFDWDEKQKSYVLSSYFWGYTLFQLPGGYAARRFGVKKCLFFGTFISSVLCFLMPYLAIWGGLTIFCLMRALQGISQGVLFPSIYQHLAKWSPLEERNRLGALTHTGLQCGVIFSKYFAGPIAASDWGWPGVYYFFSGIGISFCILWLILAENTPANSKYITNAERIYIISSQETSQEKKKIPVPWKAMFKSGPLLSLAVVRLCDAWGYTTMMTEIPAYLHGVLKMDISNNAFYSALPYVAMWVFSYIFMISADVVLKNEWSSLLVIRKTINTISMWGPTALFIVIGFLSENQNDLAIFCITLAVGLNGGLTIGNLLNQIDLSPNHAGIIMALLNSLANIVSIVCPIVVGIVAEDETDRFQWQIVFLIAAGFSFFGNLQFLFFAQTDTQPWNDEKFMASFDPDQETKVEETTSNAK